MGVQPLKAVRQKAVALLGYPQTHDEKVDYWREEIDRQAHRYGLRSALEVEDLRMRVPEFLERGDEEHLRHAVSRINPHAGIAQYSPVLVHHESHFDYLVLSPSTVFDYHYLLLRELTALIMIRGVEVQFYDAKRQNLAKYIASATIPEAALLQGHGRLPAAVQLVADYTDLRIRVEDLARMDYVSFHKKGEHWFMRLGA